MPKFQNEPKQNVHGNGLIFDKVGIIIRGASGSGKSLLTLSLLDYGQVSKIEAVLVGDDRLDLFVDKQRLNMSVPTKIAGKIELSGRGIINLPYQKTAIVGLLVDLVKEFVRMPELAQFSTKLHGVKLARCAVPELPLISLEHQRMLVLQAVKSIRARSG